MRSIWFIGLSFGALVSHLHSSQAAFGEDGKSVYAVESGGIRLIHTDTGEITDVDVHGVSKPEAIARAGGGSFYLVTKQALWMWTPGEKPAVLVEQTGANRLFRDVAANPITGQVLVVGNMVNQDGDGKSALFYKPNAKDLLLKVWLRHLPDADVIAPEFLPDGTLLFSAEGDLWHGVLGVKETDKPGETEGDITAYRYAPVAERYSYSGSPMEYGVWDIAYGAGHVYVQLGRIGGGEAEHTLKLLAPKLSKDDSFAAHNEIADSIRVLKSAKYVGGDGGFSFLCSSPDHKKVYMKEGKVRMLAEADRDDGDLLPFRIGDKILVGKRK